MSVTLILIGAPGSLSARLAGKSLAPDSREAVLSAYKGHTSGALWLALKAKPLAPLAGSVVSKRKRQDLLLLEPAGSGDREVLGALFRQVLAKNDGVQLLPVEELVKVLTSPSRADLFIGGAAAPSYKSVVLRRGNLEPLVVPASAFKPNPRGPKPDFSRVEVIDFGQTVRLGEYEAASDAILYEVDADYRRRTKRHQLEADSTLGGALRRLRLQKGIGRGDFPGLSEKEIARIERGEVGRPHGATLDLLAERLGVPATELSTY
jgi:hypothetical protein